MEAKCSLCGRGFDVDSVSANLTGCKCPFCGGQLTSTAAADSGKRRTAPAWIFFSATALLVAVLTILLCLLWSRVQKLESALAVTSSGSADMVTVSGLAERIADLEEENLYLQDLLEEKFPGDSGRELQTLVADTTQRLTEAEGKLKKYSKALDILGDLETTDNLLDTSFANVYSAIDRLAVQEDQRYALLCDQLNNYAYSVANSLGALETDVDTVFAFSGDTAAVLDSICNNINGMETDMCESQTAHGYPCTCGRHAG